MRRVLVLIAAILTVTVAVPAVAAPVPSPSPPNEGNGSLKEVLEATAKAHIDATVKLDSSKKRQLELSLELEKLQGTLTGLSAEVAVVAAEAYRAGRLSPIAALLNSASPEAFFQRAVSLDLIASRDARKLRTLSEAQQRQAAAKLALDREVLEQQNQLTIIAKKKQDAERALASVGGRPVGGYINPNSPLAQPAPRNPDGSWPKESCTIQDPTTSGCLTPRTLHALNQARANGFTRYASCYRSSGGGEHPKGRACDLAAATSGFANVSASGGDKTYGDNLASFYIKNANALGVLYVIWYRQVWMPGTGWRSYSGGGSPAADHTNHVHLSMY